MKILHIVPTYYPAYRYGGPIKTVHELNKWLVKKGVEVVVYTTNLDGRNVLNVPLGKPVDVDGVKVLYFPVWFRPWQYSFGLHRALAKNAKNKDFDFIHITSVFLAASTLGAYYAKKFKKSYIISPRGSLMTEPLKKGLLKNLKKEIYLSLIEKRNLAGASAIHFTTEMEKDEYLKAGLPLKRAIVIPNGLNIEEFQSYDVGHRKIDFKKKIGILKDKKIILFLSRLSWKKGLDTLVPAFAKSHAINTNATLVIVGGDDEGYRKEVEQQIADSKLQVGSDVIFTGMLLGNDKIAAYRESDVFVLPSYAENFGTAVGEAMAVGTPVVITKNVGISKEVEKAGAGIVVEKNIEQVSEAILKILNNPDLAKKMGENGRKLAESKFAWPEIAKKFMAEYEKLVIDNAWGSAML